MLRHRYGSPTAFAVSCLGKEKNKIVKIFGLSLSMSIRKSKHIIFLAPLIPGPLIKGC